ncbi:S-methyl-5'-thioadenosine phosphorylase [Candidatus Bathyarchaeota archaeon ex4484_205]|nr:MAG: S-methyl-5'-thioadenosine phosphorylase [Candidatus Bathyarchaeota archaeon ex4484_205]
MVKIGIIGGSGLYELLERPRSLIVETPYGKTPRIEIGEIRGIEVAFLPRHSKPGSMKVSHAVPPHKINYRANIFGFKKLGVERIITTQAVGAINHAIPPGTFAILTQFIDMTKGRKCTFYEGEEVVLPDGQKIPGVVHIDVTQPYCPEIRKALEEACKSVGVKYVSSATYVCTEGPRFETPAEIRAYKLMGADVVGMTNVPEVILARELGICYAAIAMSTNFAAGTGPKKITHEEVAEIFKRNVNNVRKIIAECVTKIPKIRKCNCAYALKGAIAEQ